MNLHELKPADGATRTRKRIGRGPGAGQGKTAGRGSKGAKSRSGYSLRRGFEGGQMPLIRRVPKRGFKNIFASAIASVNVKDLERFPDGSVVTPELLVEHRLIRRRFDGVKILGAGTLKKKLNVQAHAFSRGAKSKIEAAGGSAEELKA